MQGGLPDRDPPGRRHPWTETPLARQELTSYRDPPVDRQTPVKTLPCPKLRLRAVKNGHKLNQNPNL